MGNDRTLFALNTGHRATRATHTGKGWAVFENATKEKVFVGALPYPNEARFKEEKSDLPYLERMQSWMQESMQGNTDGLPSVFVGHLFVAGGVVSDSEREIDLGGARAVPPDALPVADYIALGHLHKKQKMGKGNCYYSGSPLQYSFDESADKGVKVFTLNANGVQDLQDIPLTKGKKLIRLQAENADDALALLQGYPDNLVEMKLLLSAPLTSADSARLAAKENLVSLITEISGAQELQFESRKGLADSALFDAFYQSEYNTQPNAELKTLFLSILDEISEK